MSYDELEIDENEPFSKILKPALKICRDLGYTGSEVVSSQEWPNDWLLLEEMLVKGFEAELEQLKKEIVKISSRLDICKFFYLVKGSCDLYLVITWRRYIERVLIPLGVVETSFNEEVFRKIKQIACMFAYDDYGCVEPVEQTASNPLSAIKREGVGVGTIYLKKGLREKYLSELMEAIEGEL